MVFKSIFVFCVLDVESGNIFVFEGVFENVFFGQVFWVFGDVGVVFVGWWYEFFWLGICFCINCRLVLYYVDFIGGKCEFFLDDFLVVFFFWLSLD